MVDAGAVALPDAGAHALDSCAGQACEASDSNDGNTCGACDVPPADLCVDETHLLSYGTEGVCTADGCSFPTSERECQFGCRAGRCLEDPCPQGDCDQSDQTKDPCFEVECNAPPANLCIDGSLLVYSSAGLCQPEDGSCAYSSELKQCQHGCDNGSCLDDPCAGGACENIQQVTPFELEKVQIQLTTAETSVPAGTELLVTVDDRCRLERNDAGKAPVFVVVALPPPREAARDELIPYWAYAVKTTTTLALRVIESQADTDPCVVGVTTEGSLVASAASFDDTLYAQQQYLTQIAFADAIGYFSENATAKPVKIAVIDSGIDTTHPDLEASVVASELVGTNFVDGETPDVPVEGATYHGTAVAGLLAATPNNGRGLVGLDAGNFVLLPIKVANDEGKVKCSDSINAIYRAVNGGADVINMSFGGAHDDLPSSGGVIVDDIMNCLSALGDALVRVLRKGVFVAAAAGNGTLDADTGKWTVTYVESPLEYGVGTECTYKPACLSRRLRGMVSVAALDATNGALLPLSNYGQIELAAPGQAPVLAAGSTGYANAAGTSLAAPQVAAAAAYIIGFHKQRGWSYTPWLVEDILLNAMPSTESLSGKVLGGRRLDLVELKRYLQRYATRTELERRSEPLADPDSGLSLLVGGDPGELQSLHLMVGDNQIHVDHRVQLHALALHENGMVLATALADWSSSDPAHFAITGDGVGVPTEAGDYEVTVRYQGLVATKRVHVTTVDPTTGALSDLEGVEIVLTTTRGAPEGQVRWGDEARVKAYAHYADGRVRDVSSYASWSTSNQAELPLRYGRITTDQAYANKTYRITALYDGLPAEVELLVLPQAITLLKLVTLPEGGILNDSAASFVSEGFDGALSLPLIPGSAGYTISGTITLESGQLLSITNSVDWSLTRGSEQIERLGSGYWPITETGEYALTGTYLYRGAAGGVQTLTIRRTLTVDPDELVRVFALTYPLAQTRMDEIASDPNAAEAALNHQEGSFAAYRIKGFGLYASGTVLPLDKTLFDWQLTGRTDPRAVIWDPSPIVAMEAGIFTGTPGERFVVTAVHKATGLSASHTITVQAEEAADAPAVGDYPSETPPQPPADSAYCTAERIAALPYAGGAGTAAEPYLICSAAQLDQIGRNGCPDCEKYFRLMRTIDLGAYEGIAFHRIADASGVFHGVFDGGGYAIDNFHYLDLEGWASLFGWVYRGRFVSAPAIRNLIVRDAVVSGDIASVVARGLNSSGLIENVFVVGGSVTGMTLATGLSGDQYVAGEIRRSAVYGTAIRGMGQSTLCAGLTTSSGSTNSAAPLIRDSFVIADIDCTGMAGGLATSNGAQIINSYANGLFKGGVTAGGLVARNDGLIRNCFTDTEVFATGAAGGLVGEASTSARFLWPGFYGRPKIFDSHANGRVLGGTSVGGLVGISFGAIVRDSQATCDVIGQNKVGGLVGSLEAVSQVRGCYASSQVRISAESTITAPTAGSLVGAQAVAMGTALPILSQNSVDSQTSSLPLIGNE